jgi:serine O-acetyltransferase
VYSANTYGDLEAAILGKAKAISGSPSAAPVGAGEQSPSTLRNGRADNHSGDAAIACGIDLEPVASFVNLGDYWEDEFYKNNFTATEISYCLLQQQPAMHFAARWCAKEALKKCDNRFLHEEMANLELTVDESGAPALYLVKGHSRQLLPFAVSLSHTSEFAVALVIRASLPEPVAITPAPAPSTEPIAQRRRQVGPPAPGPLPGPSKQRSSLLGLIGSDLRQKALWTYESSSWKTFLKVLLTDGTMAMIFYRLMQWSRRWHLLPLEMLFNKLNVICCNCIIGRGAEFGRGFVLIHSTGVVINGKVRGGRNVYIEHQVTIGDERGQSPILGDEVFIGAGAKIVGPVSIGSGARIGANTVVFDDIPPHATAVGIPARVVRLQGDIERIVTESCAPAANAAARASRFHSTSTLKA